MGVEVTEEKNFTGDKKKNWRDSKFISSFYSWSVQVFDLKD